MTKPIIYKEVTITDVGGGSSSTYTLNIGESAEVTLTPVTSTVEDGQTLTDRYDVSFAINLYDADVLTDARVRVDAGAAIAKGTILFAGATGASDITVTDVIINGTRVFDQNRVAARLTGSKAAVTLAGAVTVATAS